METHERRAVLPYGGKYDTRVRRESPAGPPVRGMDPAVFGPQGWFYQLKWLDRPPRNGFLRFFGFLAL